MVRRKVEPVLDGELIDAPFSNGQIASLEKALYRARTATGFEFSCYVGTLADGRRSAVALHAQFRDPARSVLVAVDPGGRLIEIVTGTGVTDYLDDQSCRLACLTMSSRFTIGDIAAGLRDGIVVLAEHARSSESQEVLHMDLPE